MSIQWGATDYNGGSSTMYYDTIEDRGYDFINNKEIGNDVLPLLNSLTEWGNKYNQQQGYAKVLCE